MHKKLVMACMAVAAFAAFAMPSVASAANTPLLVEGSTAIEAGKLIEAKNTEISKFTTSLGTFECTSVILTGRVHRNVIGTVELEITSAKEGGTGALQSGAEAPECTTSAFLGGNTTLTYKLATNGLPLCLTSNSTMREDEFQVTGGACTSAVRAIRFAWDVTGIGTCQYQRATSIPGTFTTSDDSILSVSEAEFSGSGLGNPFGCPGSLKRDLKFTMTTDGTNTAVGITP